MTKTIGNVLSNKEIASGIYSMVIETQIALGARPGQFVSIYVRDESKILPRPISICQVDKSAMTIRLVYRVSGDGTEILSSYVASDKVELMGPLGNGYPIDEIDESSRVILLGGGIGIPPLVYLAEELHKLGIETTAIMGYRDSDLFLQEEIRACATSYVATEDGSVGVRGNVLDALGKHMIKGDIIMACGPLPMLSAIKKYASSRGVRCYVSMEERMACGVGACLACVCKTTAVDPHSMVNNARVCKDGPVFLADHIDI